MKRIMLMMVVVLLLTACSAAPVSTGAGAPVDAADTNVQSAAVESTPVPPSAQVNTSGDVESILITDYADATNVRNQLAYGTLLLEGTELAVTPEQAQALLPLWQAMSALSGEATVVSEELNAVQTQIAETMTVEQVQAIAALKITNTQLTEFFQSKGIVLPTPVPGETRVPGAMKNLDPEVRQATQAARQASGEAGAGAGKISRTLLYDEVVKMLTERAAQ